MFYILDISTQLEDSAGFTKTIKLHTLPYSCVLLHVGMVSFLPCLVAFLGFHPCMYLNFFFCTDSLSAGLWSSPPTSGPRPPPCSVFSFTAINTHQTVLFGGKQPGHGRVSDCYLMDFKSMVCRSAISTQHCKSQYTLNFHNYI